MFRSKIFWLSFILIAAAAGFIAFINSPFAIIGRSNPNAGTWEDDPKNWNRAFGKAAPEDVSVVHSYYWESDHFTHEYMYFFEVKASEWQKSYLEKRNLKRVAESEVRSFHFNNPTDMTPDWFAPDPVEQYHVWDHPGYHGSVWVNKTNGHMHFYGVQL